MRLPAAVLVTLAMLACRPVHAQNRATQGARGPQPLGVPGAFELREGGRTHVLRFGRAVIGVDDALIVDLADARLPATGAPAGNSAGFMLPAGPARGYFTGAEIAVPVGFAIPERHVSGNVVAAYRARVNVAPFRRVVGEHVRGTLRFRGTVTGEGGPVEVAGGDAFDVVLTGIFGDRDGTAPATAPSGPVSGRFEQTDFSSRSTVVTYRTAPDGIDYIDTVWFFSAAGVACDGVLNARASNHFTVTAPGLSFGGEGLAPLVGRALPVEPSFHYGDGSLSAYHFGNAVPSWLRFDTIALREGASASGSVYAANLPGAAMAGTVRPGHIAGTFTGIVCARRPDPVYPPPPSMPTPTMPPAQ